MASKGVVIRQILTYAAVALLFFVADPMPATYLAGCLLAAAGIAFRVWGCGHLRKNLELITSGPYAYVRHPLYLGTFLVSLGGIVAAGSTRFPGLLVWVLLGPAFLAVFIGYYLPRKKRIESERLTGLFGKPYEDYDRAVPAFVPSLSPYPAAGRQPWDYKAFRANHEIGMDILIAALFAAIWFARGLLRWG